MGNWGSILLWELGIQHRTCTQSCLTDEWRKGKLGVSIPAVPKLLAPGIDFIEDSFPWIPGGESKVKQRVGFRMILSLKECNIDPLHLQFTVGLVLYENLLSDRRVSSDRNNASSEEGCKDR